MHEQANLDVFGIIYIIQHTVFIIKINYTLYETNPSFGQPAQGSSFNYNQ